MAGEPSPLRILTSQKERHQDLKQAKRQSRVWAREGAAADITSSLYPHWMKETDRQLREQKAGEAPAEFRFIQVVQATLGVRKRMEV